MNYREQHIQMLAKFMELFPKDEGKIRNILNTYMIDPKFIPKQGLITTLNYYQQKFEQMHPLEFIFPLSPEYEKGLEGDFFLGNVLSSQPLYFYLTRIDLSKVIIVPGAPGTGKTNLLTFLLLQLFDTNVNAHVIDPKLDYRYFSRFISNIFITDLKGFKENILKPPEGVHPREWINYFTDFFCSVFSGLIIIKSILYELVNDLYTQKGIYNGSVNYPTLYDLLRHAETKKYPKFQKRDYQLDSLISRLKMINYTIGDSLNLQKGFFQELLDKNFVLEIPGVNDDIQNLIVQWLSFYHFAYRIHNHIKSENNQTIIFIDEAKRIADKSMDSTLEKRVSPFSYLLSQTREYKLSFCIATQEYSRVSSSMKSSAFTTIAFNSHNYEDIKAVKGSMGLTKEQTQVLQLLPPGYCIIKKGHLPPVLVHTPFIPIKEI